MDHRDPSLWRRPPGPGDAVPEGQADGERAQARHRGLRQVRRLSNWTAAGLVAATAVTAGYFAHVSTSASASAGTSPQQPAVGGARYKAPAAGSNHACSTAVTTALTVPVAVSGGSGVTAPVPGPPAPVPGQTTVPGQPCAPGTRSTVPPTVVYKEPHENESGDS